MNVAVDIAAQVNTESERKLIDVSSNETTMNPPTGVIIDVVKEIVYVAIPLISVSLSVTLLITIVVGAAAMMPTCPKA